MSESKTLALMLLMLVSFLLWLQFQNKLGPVYQTISSSTSSGQPLYKYVLALAGFVTLAAFLPGNEAEVLAGIIVTEALLHNTASGHNVVKDILGT